MKVVTVTNDVQGTRIQGAGGIFLVKESWAKPKADAQPKPATLPSQKNKKNEAH